MGRKFCKNSNNLLFSVDEIRQIQTGALRAMIRASMSNCVRHREHGTHAEYSVSLR